MAHDETFLLAFINDRQHAVVRRDKILVLRTDEKRPAFRSYAGSTTTTWTVFGGK